MRCGPRLGVRPVGARRRRSPRASAARCRAGGRRPARRGATRAAASWIGVRWCRCRTSAPGRPRPSQRAAPGRDVALEGGVVERRRRRGRARPGGPRRTGASGRRRARSRRRGRRDPRRSARHRRGWLRGSLRGTDRPRHDRHVAAVGGQLARQRAGHVGRSTAGEEHEGADDAHPSVVPRPAGERACRTRSRSRPAGHRPARCRAPRAGRCAAGRHRPATSSRRRRGSGRSAPERDAAPRRARRGSGRPRRRRGRRRPRRACGAPLPAPIAARGWRPAVMSESNWPRPGREALGVAVGAGDPVAHEQRPGLQQVAGRLGGQLVAASDARCARRRRAGRRARRPTAPRRAGWSARCRSCEARRAACRRGARRSRRRSPRPRGARDTSARAAPVAPTARRAAACGAGRRWRRAASWPRRR